MVWDNGYSALQDYCCFNNSLYHRLFLHLLGLNYGSQPVFSQLDEILSDREVDYK